MKKLLLSFLIAIITIACTAQQNERPESGCAGNPIPVFLETQPLSQAICPGKPVSFIAEAVMATSRLWEMSTDSGATWYASIGQVSTRINSDTYYDTLTVPVVYNEMSGYMFRCTYYSVCGYTAYRSNVAVLTVTESPAHIVTQPSAVTACIGNTADFYVAVSGGSLTWQWQQSTDGGTVFFNLPGENKSLLHFENVTAAMNGYKFRCIISSECGSTITSGDALLTVNNGSTSITSQPQNTFICEGDTARFSVTAAGNNLQYQWQRRIGGSNIYTDLPGENASQLAVLHLDEVSYYRCRISSTCINIYSNDVYGNYRKMPVFSAGETKLSCDGDVVYLTGISAEAGLNYQWMASADSGVTYAAIPGAINYPFTITSNAGNNGYRYKCYVSNGCAAGYSGITTVYSNAIALSILFQSQNQQACTGKPLNLSVHDSGPTGSYQWQISYNNGSTFSNIIPGDNIHFATTNSLMTVIPAAAGTYQYRCQLTGRCSPGIYSAPIVVTVNPVPPATDTLLYVSCDTCKLNIFNAINTTGLQWDFMYSNSQVSPYAVANPLLAGIGNYQLKKSNNAGCSSLSKISIGVKKQDTLTLCPGNNAGFTSSLTGSSYQWQINRGFGNGFEDLVDLVPGLSYSSPTGTTSGTLQLQDIRSPLLLRCKVNGNTYSNTVVVSFSTYWTGAVSNVWEDARNWSCGTPSLFSDVYILSNTARMPVVSSNDIHCRSIHADDGAVVNIKSGMNIFVNDYFQQ